MDENKRYVIVFLMGTILSGICLLFLVNGTSGTQALTTEALDAACNQIYNGTVYDYRGIETHSTFKCILPELLNPVEEEEFIGPIISPLIRLELTK